MLKIIIENSGWSVERGFYNDKYYIDTNKTDFVIKKPNGRELKQTSQFQHITCDWNYDGDVYTLFGAYFEGLYAGRDFYTCQDLVSLIVDKEASIDGIYKI